MEIITNTKPNIFKRHRLPDFKDEKERSKYWQKEKRKWLEGNEGYPGTYYHFMQEQSLKDRLTGETIEPLALERDLMIHSEVNEAKKNFTPVLILKARGTALSTFGASLCHYHLRTYPGSTTLMTSADQARISKFYQDKLVICHESYHPDIQYDIGNINTTVSKISFQLKVKHLDKEGRERVSVSDIFCNQTNKDDASAASFSGTGAIFAFFDELALNKRRNKLLQSSESCFIDPNTSEKSGLLVCGGTVEDTLNNDEIAQFQILYNKWIQMGYKVIFLPYWYRFHDKNGYIDKEAGERWYEKEYAVKSKSDDPSDLQAFLKNNPGSLDDIFSLGSTSFFSERVVEKLRAVRETIVLKEKDVSYEITDIGGKSEAAPKQKGKFIIHEHPKDFVKYKMVIDGVATGTLYGASVADGSLVAATMLKMFDPATNMPFETVATMAFRPETLEQTFPYITDFAKYYNKFSGFEIMHPEASNSTHELLPQYLLKHGLIHWLQKRVDYSKTGYVDTNKYGQPMNQHSIPYAVGRLNQIFEEYPQCITMLNVIDSLLAPSNVNADIRSSMLLFGFLIPPDFGKPPVAPPVLTYKVPYTVIVDKKTGRRATMWKTITQGAVEGREKNLHLEALIIPNA